LLFALYRFCHFRLPLIRIYRNILILSQLYVHTEHYLYAIYPYPIHFQWLS
jgi:hypothetical protein